MVPMFMVMMFMRIFMMMFVVVILMVMMFMRISVVMFVVMMFVRIFVVMFMVVMFVRISVVMFMRMMFVRIFMMMFLVGSSTTGGGVLRGGAIMPVPRINQGPGPADPATFIPDKVQLPSRKSQLA
jgi:hypothetical protein